MSNYNNIKLFKKYNPAKDIQRAPKGRAKLRELLNRYAKASVSLYGFIECEELASIVNSHCDENINAEEIYLLLLPNVLKHRNYCFYKNYIVHSFFINNFELINFFEIEQGNKPRYIPQMEEYLSYSYLETHNNEYWNELYTLMNEEFGTNIFVACAFSEIKNAAVFTEDINEILKKFENFNLEFSSINNAEKFIEILANAQNNSRIWLNKGFTPKEMREINLKK